MKPALTTQPFTTDFRTLNEYGVSRFSTTATGQGAVDEAFKHHPKSVIVLKGFTVAGQFIPVDLSDHWERTELKHAKRKSIPHSKQN